MYGPVDLVGLFCTVILRDDHSSAAGQPHKEAHHQIDQRTGGSSYCRQSLFSHKAAYYHSICRIIKLLKKSSE